MMKNNKSVLTVAVVLLATIISLLFFSLDMKNCVIATVVTAIVMLVFIHGLCVYDLGFIFMPFMFYLDIGGAINTSVADGIIVLWLLSSIKEKKDNKLVNKDIICTRKYVLNFAITFMLIMLFSMVNIGKWQNDLFLQGCISIFKILVCLLYSMFTLYYVNIYGRERFLCVMAYSTLLFDVIMIVGVVAYTRGIDLGLTFQGTYRATGTFEDPNLAAAYLFIMISFAIVYFLEKKKYLLLGASIILTLVSVILTSSKGALVSVSISLVFILIVNLIRGKIGMAFKLITGYAFTAIILIVLYNNSLTVQQICEPIFNRFGELVGNIGEDHSLAHREFLWRTAFELGMTSPIIGIGVEQFRPAATQYTGESVWNIVHNTYLTFFCELGIIGLIAFFRIWIKNAWNHFMLIMSNDSSVFYLFSMICISVSMWSISLGNFRTLWVFMTFILYEYNHIIYDKKMLCNN